MWHKILYKCNSLSIYGLYLDIKISKKTKIKFVKDRPGHDFRYALNSKKIFKHLKWKPKITFEELVSEMVREDFKSAQRDELIKEHGFQAMDYNE